MSGTYLDGDTLAQCHQALRDGKTIEHLAGRLHIDPAHLARMLGLPTLRPVPTTDEADLWRVPELESQL